MKYKDSGIIKMDNEELLRYQRQTLLPEVGKSGQEKLRDSRVLCIGAGGLGCPVLSYLASAGVGRLGIVDDDVIEVSNLQRQTLFTTDEAGKNKADTAAVRIREMNPYVDVVAYPIMLTPDKALDIFKEYDLVVDCSDSFAAKYLINDACVVAGIPMVHGAVSRFEGRVAVFRGGDSPCYRCLYPEPPAGYVPNCSEGGVIGAVSGMIGSMQALEAIKLMLDSGEEKNSPCSLCVVDCTDFRMATLNIQKDKSCPVCSSTKPSLGDSDFYQLNCMRKSEMTLGETYNLPYKVLYVDVRDKDEWEENHLPGSVNLPLHRLECGEGKELFRQNTCVLYCKSGLRSLRAFNFLKEAGVEKVYHIKGGVDTSAFSDMAAIAGTSADPEIRGNA